MVVLVKLQNDKITRIKESLTGTKSK